MSVIEFFETLRREGVEFWIESHREFKIIGEDQYYVNWMMELMENEYPDIFNFTNKKEGGLR